MVTQRCHRRIVTTVRRGAAALEVVLATGITLPIVVGMAVLGTRACRNLFHIVANLVGWPYL